MKARTLIKLMNSGSKPTRGRRTLEENNPFHKFLTDYKSVEELGKFLKEEEKKKEKKKTELNIPALLIFLLVVQPVIVMWSMSQVLSILK